jgi:hypothetical protein
VRGPCSSHGRLVPRQLVFKYQSVLGDALAHQLFDSLKISRLATDAVPRSFADYGITLERSRYSVDDRTRGARPAGGRGRW